MLASFHLLELWSYMSFKLDVDKWVKQTQGNNDKVFRGALLQVFGQIVKGTPVGNPSLWKGPAPEGYVGGRLRNNWNTSIGNPDLSTNRPPEKSGNGSDADLLISLAKLKTGDVAYLSNNLPYAEAVENGSSTQAPTGWVKNTVKSFNRAVNSAARKVKK